MTAAELARLAAVSPDRVERLASLGILTPTDGSFRPSDIQRIRLVDAFEGAGVSAETLARAIAAGLRSLDGFDVGFPSPPASSGPTLAQLCAELGHDVAEAEATFAALALPVPSPDSELREDDAEAIADILALYDLRPLGLDENLAPRMARIYGDGARRAAEASVHLWDEAVETRLNALDPSGALAERRIAARAALSAGLERSLVWLHRRHTEHQTLGVIVENTERALERAGLAEPRRAQPAIAFVDLTGSTTLTEERGDEAAGELAATLGGLVDEILHRRRGKTVKHLGDGVMLHFPGAGDATAAALELVQRAPEAGLPQARVGIEAGRLVFRDGDYYGRTVITAARITDYARPGEVLVSEAAAAEIGDEAVLEPLGPVRLRGLREPVALSRARRP